MSDRAVQEPLARSLRRGVPLVWVSGDDVQGPRALLGWGERFRAEAGGPDRFTRLADAFARHCASLGPDAPTPIAFVTVAFADDSAASSVLVVPEVLGRWADGVLTWAPDADLPDPDEPAEFEELDVRSGQLTREGYRRAVATAVQRIADAAVEKVVLARDLEATSTDPICVPAVLERLLAANPTAYTFHVDGLLGASPELLVAVRGSSVRSRVLAGSAIVTGVPAEDDAAAEALAASAKNIAEHDYAVRSVADRLAEAADVRRGERSVLRLPRIMHLATEVCGTLTTRRSALDLAALVHPSAAVCGTPTEAAARLVAELEGFDRGRYAGPVGWLDADGDGEFAIALRCGQVSPDGRSVRLFAGGGIVAGSVPSEELAETARKFLPMYEALSPLDRP